MGPMRVKAIRCRVAPACACDVFEVPRHTVEQMKAARASASRAPVLRWCKILIIPPQTVMLLLAAEPLDNFRIAIRE
jgi:hypothetical protein